MRAKSNAVLTGLVAAGVLLSFPLHHAAGAQELSAPQAQLNKGEKSGHIIVVPRKNEAPQHGLGANDFTLKLGGKETKLARVRPTMATGEGMAIVLLMDTSGSMKGARIAAAREAAQRFTDNLRPLDQVAILTFDARPRTALNYTSEKSVVRNVLNKIQAGSNDTALYDAIDQARSLPTSVPLERRALVLLTDGKDNASALTASDIVTLANKKEVPALYALGVGDAIDEKTLSRLSRMAGGVFIRTRDTGGMVGLYETAWAQIADAYTLMFPVAEPQNRAFEVAWKVDKAQSVTAKGTLAPYSESPSIVANGTTPSGQGNDKTVLILGSLLLLALAAVLLLRRRTPGAVAGASDGLSSASSPLSGSSSSAANQSGGSVPLLIPSPLNNDMNFGPSAGAVGGGSGSAAPAARAATPGRASDEGTFVKQAPAPPTLAWLVSVSGPLNGRKFEITREESIIGRSHDAEVSLADDREVSRHHAKLVRVAGGDFSIVDMASTNGVQVNGSKIYEAAVQDGDTIQIGLTELIFKSLQR